MADEKKVPADKAMEQQKNAVNNAANRPTTNNADVAEEKVVTTGGKPVSAGEAKPFSDPRAEQFSRPHADKPRDEPKKTNAEDFDAFEKDDPKAVVASANFSITEFQDIYAAIRDGDYWSAFKRSLKFLNDMVNDTGTSPARGPVTRGIRPMGGKQFGETVTKAELADIDRTIEAMEEQLGSEETRFKVSSGSASEAAVTSPQFKKGGTSAPMAGMSVQTVLMLAGMVLEFVKKWRESRS